jgi:hypothetical protein
VSKSLKPPAPARSGGATADDTARLALSRADRKKLGIDAWEPSLLRKLLAAQNRLKTRK